MRSTPFVLVPTALARLRSPLRRRMAAALAAEARMVHESARSFRQLFEDNPQLMFVVEQGTFRILAANQAAVARYGYTRGEFLDMRIPDLRWPGEMAPFQEVTDAIAGEGRTDFQAFRTRTKQGDSFDIELHLREVDFERRPAWLGVLEDVTERIKLQYELVERARSFRALFDANPQPMFVREEGTFRIVAANTAAVAHYGYTESEFLDMTVPDLRWPAQMGQFQEIADAIAVDGRRGFQAIRHRSKGGCSFDVEVQVRDVDFEGRHAWLSVVDDVTDRLRLQRELEHQAFHDSLTNLPNRALFYNRVEHVQRRLVRSRSRYAVLLVDLDDFKTVNDSFGHCAGDELLLEVSRRLAETMRPGDTAARLGGDEFGIILEDLEGEGEPIGVADRVLSALRHPFAVAGGSVTLSATIGIALSGDATTAATDVVRNADIALYAGKARGKDRPQVFAEEMRAAVLGRITLKQELREGICRGEFALLYQPKVDSRSGLVVGVEALVRWNHPLRGLLMPDAFIALAEESGLIVDLDAWVLETACRQAATWARSPAGPLPVAVNVSGRELERAGLLGRVRRVLAVTGLDPRLLELELTESAALQEEALSMLREIRALGIRIAIDDFGTGFSMLSRLQDFPFDTLKIDRSFISRITSVDADCPIVSATVAMGRGLGLEIVAEGVETEQQRAYLVRQGCGQLQGYLVSRPVAPQLIPAMLSSPPLPPIQDPRWVALESAIGVATAEPPLEELVRGLLVELQRLTGLDSVYLTRVCWERSEQEVLFSRNSGCITVRERLILPWPETLSQTAPTGSAHHTDRLPVEFLQSRAASTLLQQTSVSVPVLLSDGSIFGTLCGASGRHVPLTQPGLEVMRIFGSLIAAQIAAPMTSNTVSHRTELPLGE
ncbi:MAG: hypothetical protein QOE72_951 [Chloroflexota bacterium]|nr:hypothetical protein [Chloroflexota bacterium]